MTSDTELYKTMYHELIAEVGPWYMIAQVWKIQTDSGILDIDTRNVDWSERFQNLSPKVAALVIHLGINQKLCNHPKALQEVIGHVPMGSFTAKRERCNRCGLVRLDD